MAEFTPGPWSIEELPLPHGVKPELVIVSSGGDCIARIGYNLTPQRANSALIAAAPALYAIARRLVALCPSDEGLGGHAPIGAFLNLGHSARAALDLVSTASR